VSKFVVEIWLSYVFICKWLLAIRSLCLSNSTNDYNESNVKLLATKCKMQIAMGPLKSLTTQIIASHVKLNQLQVTSLRGVEPQSKWTLPTAAKNCSQKYI
jgi:hypothetical protein